MIAIIILAISFGLGFVYLILAALTKEEKRKPYYATTCKNCGLEFDFGDYDIKMYTDESGKQHQITQCPRCKTYINVDP